MQILFEERFVPERPCVDDIPITFLWEPKVMNMVNATHSEATNEPITVHLNATSSLQHLSKP